MIITYKGTLQTVYETEVDEELGRTRKTLKEVYLKSEDGNHDIPESIEKKLRYRIEHNQLKDGDTYSFDLDLPVHIAFLEEQREELMAKRRANVSEEEKFRIAFVELSLEEEIAKWKAELKKYE